MKTNLFKTAFIACVSLALFAGVFSSCKTTEPEKADTTVLTAVIDSCQMLADAATTADYKQTDIDAFKATLATAKTAVANSAITQTAVDNLVVQLRAAKATFMASAFSAIPANALLLGLSFNEGTGTQLTTTGKPMTAVLTAGPSQIFGSSTGLPTFVDGKVGKAMYFKNGSHLEISNYTASDFLANKLSISLWVKPDSTRENNYLVSFNYWNTWKFQLQLQNKPFFTTHTLITGMPDGWVDADNQADNSAKNNTWTHLVVSLDLTVGTLSFYVNGENTMTWDKVAKPGLTGALAPYSTVLPLMIGAGFPYSEGIAKMGTEGWWQTKQAFPHYAGLMDELKIYNVALTDGQVAKLYQNENK